MRVADAFLAQREALRDAETVLLVDNGQTQFRQRYLVLEKRVRADRELRFATLDRRQRAFALLRRQAARQPRYVQRQALEPRSELAVMLFRQDFRRGHECHLIARLDRLQGGQRRDHGLAAADVALQQPLHRIGLGEVSPDLRDHALLGSRQHERQPCVQRLGERAVSGQPRRTAARARAAVHLERKLLREEFIELESRPCRMRALVERAL